jgi:hypothetical protein
VIPLYTLVKSVKEIRYGKITFPVGSTGTVVDVVINKPTVYGYYVEFTDPFHEVVDVDPDEIEEVKHVD